MSDLTALNATFAIPGIVALEAGEGGLTRIAVTSLLAEAHVYLHGGHVTYFQPRGQEPVLFMSRKSHFSTGKAIRGGIPVIFPWFGPRAGDAAAPQHGFARTASWGVREIKQSDDGAIVITLALGPSDATRQWLADFNLVYTISIGTSLDLSLQVNNSSADSIKFEEALHTYLSVADVRNVGVEGLSGRRFIDKVAGMQRKVQPPGPIQIEGETDRVYLDAPETVRTADPGMSRQIAVSKHGSLSTVVWNPWIEKARAMSDFGDDEWPRMLCIETANAADNAIVLPAGQTHSMEASITVTTA